MKCDIPKGEATPGAQGRNRYPRIPARMNIALVSAARMVSRGIIKGA